MAENTAPKISIASAGLNLDADPITLEQGEYRYALNATVSNKNGGMPFIGNDEGNEFAAAIPAGYLVMGQRKMNNNDTVLMLASFAEDSEIGIFANGKYKKVVNDAGLGFTVENLVQVKYKLNHKGQRLIYFTTKDQPARWLNLEDPAYLKEYAADGCTFTYTGILDLDYMAIFKDYTNPCLIVADVTENGRLESASYFITSQYADANSNGLTTWSPLIGPIPIYRDSISQAFESISGVASEQRTSKSILVRLSESDTSFSHINLSIVKVQNGVRRAFKVATVGIGTTEYLYTGVGAVEAAVELSDIIQPAIAYKSARTIEATNTNLLLGNLTSQRLFNFQPYVSKLQVQWQVFKAWSDDTKNSFKNPKFSAYMRVFREDEVYALGLTLEMTDGTESTWHIPGRKKNLKSDGTPFPDGVDQFGEPVSGAEWDSKAVVVDDDIIDPTKIQRYQNYNTALKTGSLSTGSLEGFSDYGEMGYWESTERYDCNKDIYGEDAGEFIRHHQLPDSSIFHIHDGEDEYRQYNERVKLNYLGLRLPNIDEVIASLPVHIRVKVKGWRLAVADRTYNKSVLASGIMLNARQQNWRYPSDTKDDFRLFPNYPLNDLRPDPYIRDPKVTTAPGFVWGNVLGELAPGAFIDYKKDTFFFHSPDTHFKKSFLSAGELKITAQLYGKTDSYYEFVDPYPEFKEKGDDTDRAALQGVSIATYNNYHRNPKGQTRRKLKDAFYVPFNSKVGGGSTQQPVWNILRESSVLLATTKDIIDPSEKDTSRFILNDVDGQQGMDESFNCTIRSRTRNASIYYATIKNPIPNQYGTLHDIRYNDSYSCTGMEGQPSNVVFAGDTFIGAFAMKTQNVFYQNAQDFMDSPKGMEGADFKPTETIAHTSYYYRNRGTGGNPRQQSRMMCEDNVGHGIFGIGGDGNATGLGWLALMMFGVPNFWAESDFNLELRVAGETADTTFYKHLSQGLFKVNDWLSIKNIRKDNSFVANEDYSAKNDIKLITGISPLYDPNETKDNHYSTRVIGSLPGAPEDILDNWIRFKALDYKDLTKTRGELVDIRYLGNYRTLFRMEQAVLMDTLYAQIGSSEGALSLGSGKMFEKEPTEMLATDNGYGGTCSQLAFSSTPAGAFFPDADRGKVFTITDGLKEITKGLSDWFSENLPFKLSQQIPGISKDNASNPNGIGLLCEWDEANRRWFLTKKDYSLVDPANAPRMRATEGGFLLDDRLVTLNDTKIFENKSWTLSYSPDNGHWISWHSFLPGFYIQQDLALYSGEESSIWYHRAGLFHHYYGRPYPFIVGNVDKMDGISSFVNPHISFISRVIGPLDESKKLTFNKAVVSNLYESSGLLNLIIQDELDLSSLYTQLKNNATSRDVALRIREGHFNFSDFYNICNHDGQHFFTNDWASPEYKASYPIDKVVNHQALDYNKRHGDYSLMRERWLEYRLILDNRHDLKLLLQFVLIANRQSVS
jgi:hypothetical protein